MTNDSPDVHFDESPSMAGTSPGWFIIWCILCPVVIGIIALLIWKAVLSRTRLTIVGDRVVYRTGFFSSRESEIRAEDVRNVEIDKTFFQKLTGTGTLSLSTSGQSGMEIEIRGLAHPERVRDIINSLRS